MLKPELEQLIRQSLRALSAIEHDSAEGTHRYELVDGLAERLGRRDLLLTFSARTAAHRDDVELVTAGSYLYDLILRLVREKGRAAAGWLPPSPDLDAPRAIQRVAPRLKGRPMKRLKAAWGVIYLFTFRFSFHFDTPHEKLYTVRVDHDGDRIRHDVHPWRLIEPAAPEAPLPWGASPRVDPERAFRFAWEKVEEEVARLTARYGQEAEILLRDEIQMVEQYYRQLIEEEKRAREQKNTRKGREESEQKIEILKLEWDRRLAEEKRRIRPEVSVTLSCAAYLRTPLERWRCLPRAGTRETVAEFWVDAHSGEAWPARANRRKAAAGARAREQAADDGPAGEGLIEDPADTPGVVPDDGATADTRSETDLEPLPLMPVGADDFGGAAPPDDSGALPDE